LQFDSIKYIQPEHYSIECRTTATLAGLSNPFIPLLILCVATALIQMGRAYVEYNSSLSLPFTISPLSAAAFRYLMGLEENLTRQLHSLISTLEK
jgi:hypothetical protein